MFGKNGSKVKGFVKVCPNCLSANLNVRIFDLGSFYDCKDCGMKEFYPLEFDESKLAKAKQELIKNVSNKKKK